MNEGLGCKDGQSEEQNERKKSGVHVLIQGWKSFDLGYGEIEHYKESLTASWKLIENSVKEGEEECQLLKTKTFSETFTSTHEWINNHPLKNSQVLRSNYTSWPKIHYCSIFSEVGQVNPKAFA